MRLLLVLGLSALLSGCSTIIYGTTQDLVVNTDPQGATASVGKNSCETPCKLHVSKKIRTINLSKEGYGSKIVQLRRRSHFFSLVPANIFTSAGLGIIVDLANGSNWELQAVDETMPAAYD